MSIHQPKKGYKLLGLQIRCIFVNKDVVFKENIIPFEVHPVISQTPSQVPLDLYDDERMQLPDEQEEYLVADLPVTHLTLNNL